MRRINPNLKCCNVCHDSLPLTAFYEGKNTCKSCERERELKPGQIDNNVALAGWKR